MKYISLVNLIADREVVKELVADGMTVKNIQAELKKLLAETPERKAMLDGYDRSYSDIGKGWSFRTRGSGNTSMLELKRNRGKYIPRQSIHQFVCELY